MKKSRFTEQQVWLSFIRPGKPTVSAIRAQWCEETLPMLLSRCRRYRSVKQW